MSNPQTQICPKCDQVLSASVIVCFRCGSPLPAPGLLHTLDMELVNKALNWKPYEERKPVTLENGDAKDLLWLLTTAREVIKDHPPEGVKDFLKKYDVTINDLIKGLLK